MSPKNDFYPSRKALAYKGESNGRQMSQQDKPSYFSLSHFLFSFYFSPVCCSSLHDNKPVYRLPQQSIRRLAFVPPYSVFCSISFRCGGLSIERNQKPLTPEITLALAHHYKQKQVEVKRSSRANPHEFRLFSGCPYYFTLPMDGNYNSFPKHLRQPCKERRSFSMNMYYIVSSECAVKCGKER